ncbi:MAG: DUF4097 family beta strand repeat-containing protein [Bacillota bacterium]
MSQDERLMILQMVAEKKISAAEAAELLKVLDGKEAAPPQPGPSHRGGSSFVPPPAPPARPAPPTSPAHLGSGFSAFIEEVVERVSSALGDLTLTGPRHEFPAEISGQFAGEQVPLRIYTGNGHVELKGWDQPGYKAQILVKARGATEEEARRRAHEAYLVTADEQGFQLETNRRYDWTDLAVNVTLFLPKEKAYKLESRTGNGHISVEGVTLLDGTATSGNGRITMRGGADRLYLKSGNGSIEVDGDVADLEAHTGNGSIKLVPLGRRSESHQLKTGNGSITVDTGRLSRETGLYVDASTGMGSVGIARTDLVYERQDRNAGHKHVVARSQGYETAPVRVTLRARTGLGSVSVE